MTQRHFPSFRRGSFALMLLASACLACTAFAQFDPDGGTGNPASSPPDSVKHNEDPIKIVHPTVDMKAHSVSIPAAFWNQKMTNWVEVAVCGRPSDFLHETVVCTTTTKDIMEAAMREAGFHDADAWTESVRDFPRVRGDRFLITLAVTRKDKPGNPVEKYSLDELLTFQGWGVSTGPYGWMFKGSPGRSSAATAPAEKDAGGAEDRTLILRDDPQIALVFKGIQHQSQSYADHPLAYDDWIYPMMRYNRNTRVLPNDIYDSNGEFAVTMTLTKCTEEEFLNQTAKLWHDPSYAKYILEQLPTAKQIDKDKADLWALLPEIKKMKETAAELRDAAKEAELTASESILMAKIEKGYATLDASWARYAADHAVYESTDDKELAELKLQAKRWRDHMEQKQTQAEQLAIAEETDWDIKKLGPESDANKKERQQLTGKELEARSRAILAADAQPRDHWKAEQARLSPDDPRKSWKASIDGWVDLLAARNEVATTGLAYARALQSAPQDQIAAAEKVHTAAKRRMLLADLNLKLVDTDFEIEKREAFTDDPDLPGLQKRKAQLEGLIKNLAAATQPAK